MLAGATNTAKDLGPAQFPWWLDWRGQMAAIVASGPSANKHDLNVLRGRARVIAVNESWKLVPWADVLYGCDKKWWFLHLGVQEFKGLKLAYDVVQGTHKIEIPNVHSNEILVDQPGVVGAGGNSGFQALNLAVQFGAVKILLIGFDMNDGEHWHGRHPPPLSNPCPLVNMPRWKMAFDNSAGKLHQLGVRVINCSLESALRAYPKMTLEEALR